ncbi:hypothetical protein SAMN05421748_12249 [Paractinoplanes atraurantiacus]|uniref:CshA domain-containing protein n=2 Tax=Paractinoplanes atraurantiacus TaxID=1036182 RepID=A0A285JL18_9ACTN|nr:hypothetical protein SAMN05421748_12249 [Actinoplanes atraurantiacus]
MVVSLLAAPALALTAAPAFAAAAAPDALPASCPAVVTAPTATSDHLTSTGAGLHKQTVTVDVPPGWRMTLDNRDPSYIQTVLVPDGFYTQDSPRTVTYTPKLRFIGTAAPVTIRLSAPDGRSRTVTYSATVTCPPPPSAPDHTTTGSSRAFQSVTFAIPPGGVIGLADGQPLHLPQGELGLAMISSISTIPGQPHDDTLIGAAGTLVFTPTRGASGPIPPVRYTVTDSYGQTSTGLYTPTIKGY